MHRDGNVDGASTSRSWLPSATSRLVVCFGAIVILAGLGLCEVGLGSVGLVQPSFVTGRRSRPSAPQPNVGVESFEVVGVDADHATLVARHAAALRRRISAELLGIADPVAWTPRCVIHVHRTERSFAEAVGGAPVTARGATSIEFFGADVGMRRIDVICEASAGLIPDAIGHELVHVILADRFTDRPPPRWADEGLAMLFDTEAKQRGHDEDFREAAGRGLAWAGQELFEIEIDPADGARERVFYGESLALVRWFLERRDVPTFLSFLDDCEDSGLSAALEKHYGMKSLADFDGRWEPVLTAAR
jgi:hypothetical protein